MIIFSIAVSIFTGNIDELVKAIFDSSHTAIDLCINIVGLLCMWNGFMKIAERSGFINIISQKIKPIIKFLFPEISNHNEISGHIGMNIAANMLGLGNIATPSGIKAMEKLQEINNDKSRLSNSMLMFLVLNTASIQLIPTTVIALRANYNSENPTSIVVPTIISSITSVIVGIIIVKIISLSQKHFKKRRIHENN